MLKVGITGSIASGKSFISSHLRKEGFDVFDSDTYVKTLYKNSAIQTKLFSIFPQMKIIDKPYIMSCICGDKNFRDKINQLFHPLVQKKMLKYFAQHNSRKLIFAEVPLLFEASFQSHLDYIICAYAKPSTRLKRFAIRNDLTVEQVSKQFYSIEQLQISAIKKAAKSDFIIYTNNSKFDIVRQIKEITYKISHER